MAKLTDPEIERCYQNALRNWKFSGFVIYDKDADSWVRENLEGVTFQRLSELLFEFVVNQGGEIDQVVEQRFNWVGEWSHHYDLRPIINGIALYVETRLRYRDPDDPDDPIIHVVNVKRA